MAPVPAGVAATVVERAGAALREVSGPVVAARSMPAQTRSSSPISGAVMARS
jgi:hypothetical protein